MSAREGQDEADAAAGKSPALHATAVVIEEAGIVIRGRSGAGKSTLALALIQQAQARGMFARLIGDDRVRIVALNGRVMVEGHPAIAGKIERRGSGILDVPHESRAVVRLVVDLLDADGSCGNPPRLPESADRQTAMESMEIPRLALRANAPATELADRVLFELPKAKAAE